MNKPSQAFVPLCTLVDPNPKTCKPAGRPKAADLEARQAHLVQTAGHLFLEHGYANVSLEMIAREAHVAVRTIYIKFGGKAGLLKAAIDANRERFYRIHDLENDPRPLRDSLTEFAHHFFDMITTPQAVRLKRMVLSESNRDPEMTQTFLASGPRQTNAMLARFFDKPESRAQIRADAPIDELPTFFLNSIVGDQFQHLLDTDSSSTAAYRARIPARLDLFFHAVLRDPRA
jgi:AcrR family transcriptional regulator